MGAERTYKVSMEKEAEKLEGRPAFYTAGGLVRAGPVTLFGARQLNLVPKLLRKPSQEPKAAILKS